MSPSAIIPRTADCYWAQCASCDPLATGQPFGLAEPWTSHLRPRQRAAGNFGFPHPAIATTLAAGWRDTRRSSGRPTTARLLIFLRNTWFIVTLGSATFVTTYMIDDSLDDMVWQGLGCDRPEQPPGFASALRPRHRRVDRSESASSPRSGRDAGWRSRCRGRRGGHLGCCRSATRDRPCARSRGGVLGWCSRPGARGENNVQRPPYVQGLTPAAEWL